MNALFTLPLFVFLLLVARKAWSLFGRSWTSPLRFLPGPKSPKYFFGHIKEIANADHSVVLEHWVAQYGKTFKYYGLGNVSIVQRCIFFRAQAQVQVPHLFTMDTRALNHVLSHSEYYLKPELARVHLSQNLGEGLLVVEGPPSLLIHIVHSFTFLA